MSAFSVEEMAHLAALARIEMTEDELSKLGDELGVIVDAVKSISDVAGEDVPKTSHPLPLSNVMREDVVGKTLTQDEALSGAPDSADGRFKVPAILDGE
ncbi:Asp-tRNA(Asn)/Glu-tRNA(Gln) amidotransferase subunit GatC [Falsarthrobacter nasiphocae]|uniref:Aspartyl/glutamyl-tRNA(Asn/Gln) amidotransferase subunit C n=1 Tax=Falsarthrobacter nasiphocae TaxID=189863 RepID=A0AAE4C8N7_9MICC|nr:Asp-tRNA(Asn)/Glu-tRNA(Gln) amidotransferase subunit GatC [Falsarthrobacter nasiphocae]MDR6892600.1 aspartyl-tRNA(Asn)/glutamyl-tRNA(Gln) amidotransferase subunit C [Falsarthrobacter nasiphocae]